MKRDIQPELRAGEEQDVRVVHGTIIRRPANVLHHRFRQLERDLHDRPPLPASTLTSRRPRSW